MSFSFKSVSWSLLDNVSQQLINFVVGIVLARLLMPEDFGVVGIVVVFISFANLFVDLGLNEAVINKQHADSLDFNTLFWSNIFLGFLSVTIIYFNSNFLSDFFDIEELSFYLRLTSLGILFYSISSIQRVLLTKELNFKIIAQVSFISVFVSGCVAIYMAFAGYGALSLVVRMSLGQFITMLLFLVQRKWQPSFKFEYHRFISMLKYGSNLFFTRFANSLFSNVIIFVIGKIYTPQILGFYSRADNFKNLFSNNLSLAIQRVSFSDISRNQTEDSQNATFYSYFKIHGYLLTILCSVLVFCSEEFIILLIGQKWLPSLSYMNLLILFGVVYCFYNFNLNFLAARGDTKQYFYLELVSKLFLAIPVVSLFWISLNQVLYLLIICSLISLMIVSIYFKMTFRNKINHVIRYQVGFVLFLFLIFYLNYFSYKIQADNLYLQFLMNLSIVLFLMLIKIILINPKDVSLLFRILFKSDCL